jgi:peptidoglycan/LPS O-acetylase OafA/YrhL
MTDFLDEIPVPLLNLISLGIPGLAAGILAGWWIKTWRVAIALIVLGFLLALLGGASIPDDPDDDDAGLGYALIILTNLAGWIIGIVATKATRGRNRTTR